MAFWKKTKTPALQALEYLESQTEIRRLRAEFEEKLEAADALTRVARQSERLRCAAIVREMYGFTEVNEILEKILEGDR